MAVTARPTRGAIVHIATGVAQGERTLALSGTNFVTVADATPDVSFGEVVLGTITPEGCVKIDGTLLDAKVCTSLAVVVPQDGLATGAHDVVVHNPPPAGCVSTESRRIAVVPPPRLDKV